MISTLWYIDQQCADFRFDCPPCSFGLSCDRKWWFLWVCLTLQDMHWKSALLGHSLQRLTSLIQVDVNEAALFPISRPAYNCSFQGQTLSATDALKLSKWGSHHTIFKSYSYLLLSLSSSQEFIFQSLPGQVHTGSLFLGPFVNLPSPRCNAVQVELMLAVLESLTLDAIVTLSVTGTLTLFSIVERLFISKELEVLTAVQTILHIVKDFKVITINLRGKYHGSIRYMSMKDQLLHPFMHLLWQKRRNKSLHPSMIPSNSVLMEGCQWKVVSCFLRLAVASTPRFLYAYLRACIVHPKFFKCHFMTKIIWHNMPWTMAIWVSKELYLSDKVI